MIGLLSMTPSTFPASMSELGLASVQSSFATLVDQFGPLAAVCLIGLVIQALIPRWTTTSPMGRIVAGIRGALIGAVAGAAAEAPLLSGSSDVIAIVALAIMLGLAEAEVRRHVPTTA